MISLALCSKKTFLPSVCWINSQSIVNIGVPWIKLFIVGDYAVFPNDVFTGIGKVGRIFLILHSLYSHDLV